MSVGLMHLYKPSITDHGYVPLEANNVVTPSGLRVTDDAM